MILKKIACAFLYISVYSNFTILKIFNHSRVAFISYPVPSLSKMLESIKKLFDVANVNQKELCPLLSFSDKNLSTVVNRIILEATISFIKALARLNSCRNVAAAPHFFVLLNFCFLLN